MKILSVDSSSEAASVSILSDTGLIGEMNFNYKKQHSVILMTMIENLFENLNMSIDDIDGFVVSKGPGSFTGLRIGMATIKSMAMATKKPYISVSSLDGLANNIFGANGIVCPVMDALRGNVYCGIYKFSDNILSPLSEYMILSMEELSKILNSYNETVFFVGDGTEKHSEKLKNLVPNCVFAPSHLNLTRSSSLGYIGINLLLQGLSDDLNASSPLYLRKSQAEREYEKKTGMSIDD